MQGTVFWMAPEVIDTQKKGYNFKIDIWSVGCVILEMWAGSRPWLGDEPIAVIFKVRLVFRSRKDRQINRRFFSSIKQNYRPQYLRVLSCLPLLMILG
jgi:serine/threonine protein kinase